MNSVACLVNLDAETLAQVEPCLDGVLADQVKPLRTAVCLFS